MLKNYENLGKSYKADKSVIKNAKAMFIMYSRIPFLRK